MKKFLLSAAVLATLAAPAFAGRLDNAEFSGRQDTVAPQADIDYGTTASIRSNDSVRPNTAVGSDAAGQSDVQRGDQGSLFGANGH